MLLLFVYGIGLGLPFVLAGLALGTSLRLMSGLKTRMHALEVVSGLLLVGMGLLIFSDRLSIISAWLTAVFGTGLAT
jgi:cytochrome c-type biogenesis protein